MVNLSATIRSPTSTTPIYNPTGSQLHLSSNNKSYHTKSTVLHNSINQPYGTWYYNTDRLSNTFNLNTSCSSARTTVLSPYEKKLIQQSAQYKLTNNISDNNIQQSIDVLHETTNSDYGLHANNKQLNIQHAVSMKDQLWPDYNKTKQNIGLLYTDDQSNDISTYRAQCNDITHPVVNLKQ